MKPIKTRAWVNNIDFCGGAYIQTELDEVEYSIEIASCNSKIRLHGVIANEEALSNAYHKIDTIVEHLQALRASITTQSEKIAIENAKKVEAIAKKAKTKKGKGKQAKDQSTTTS